MPRQSAGLWRSGLTAVLAVAAPLAPAQAQAVPPPTLCAVEAAQRIEAEANADQIRDFVLQRRARVLTFQGYSGAGYEDPATMLALARQVLAAHDPKTTLVSSGGTASGIGAVYAVARAAGFGTMGIVSSLARDEQVPLADCVQQVFFVPDATWGGWLADQQRWSPTSAAVVEHSDEMIGFGGGEIARDEMLAARRAGKPVTFYPADLNHAQALAQAARKRLPVPTDFRGAAHRAMLPPATGR